MQTVASEEPVQLHHSCEVACSRRLIADMLQATSPAEQGVGIARVCCDGGVILVKRAHGFTKLLVASAQTHCREAVGGLLQPAGVLQVHGRLRIPSQLHKADSTPLVRTCAAAVDCEAEAEVVDGRGQQPAESAGLGSNIEGRKGRLASFDHGRAGGWPGDASIIAVQK